MALNRVSPMLQVENIDESINYYQEVLGFTLEGRVNNDWAKLGRDNIFLMLTSRYGEESKISFTGSIYIYTDNIEGLWKEFRTKVEIAYPLESFSYGMKEFALYDCNKYLIQFGQETT